MEKLKMWWPPGKEGAGQMHWWRRQRQEDRQAPGIILKCRQWFVIKMYQCINVWMYHRYHHQNRNVCIITRLTYNCAHLRSTKESLTDSVKKFFVRKFFCVKIFLGENLLGEHFLSEHFFGVKFFGGKFFWVKILGEIFVGDIFLGEHFFEWKLLSENFWVKIFGWKIFF